MRAAGVPLRIVGDGPERLPLNQPVDIEFTPDKQGNIAFACGMEIQYNALVRELRSVPILVRVGECEVTTFGVLVALAKKP